MQVKFAVKYDTDFLVYNGVHGATTTLGKMKGGIEIFLEQLNNIEIASDGKTATIQGGANSKMVIDALWQAGKQTVTGTCECVSYMGPALGGGHGWLQGHHGLLADQWVSMNLVLADGSIETIDSEHELMWALKGAGHNFGIVTSVISKIYDIEHPNWAIETFVFSGDKVEEVYSAANELINHGKQAIDVIHWSYWLNDPTLDSEKPVIIFYLIQEGVDAVSTEYSQTLHDVGPILVTPDTGDYRKLAGWTGIALDSPPCQKNGGINPRFPIYLDEFDIPAVREAYDLYAANISGQDNPFYTSLFMFEAYSNQGVRDIDAKSTAFAFRRANILAAPLVTYASGEPKLDKEAEQLGNKLRDILHKATDRNAVRAYVNYGYGNEKNNELYGDEDWRLRKLQALKMKYDSKERFSFYHPIKI